MKTYTKFKEYIWLVNTIYHAKAITLADINKKWLETDMSEGVQLSRTTFHRHRIAIEEMFGLFIECDKRNGNKYYIGNSDVLEEESVQNWMLSTMSVGNMVSESQSLHHRILLEDIPSGGDKLQLVMKAMKENRQLMMTYKRYSSPSGYSCTIDPFCVKLFRQRWYMLGRLSNGWLATYSFDRIESIELLESKFKLPDDFDAAEYFRDSYGIVVDDSIKTERIVLRAYGYERFYLRDLPLHHSQRVISKTDDYTDFELHIKPTSDFKTQLFSRGGWLQVLEPQALADELAEWHIGAVERHKK